MTQFLRVLSSGGLLPRYTTTKPIETKIDLPSVLPFSLFAFLLESGHNNLGLFNYLFFCNLHQGKFRLL